MSDNITVPNIKRVRVFLSMDLPGGAVDRLPEPITIDPGQQVIVALGDDGRLHIERKSLS